MAVLVLSYKRSQAMKVSAALLTSPESKISSKLQAVPEVSKETRVYKAELLGILVDSKVRRSLVNDILQPKFSRYRSSCFESIIPNSFLPSFTNLF